MYLKISLFSFVPWTTIYPSILVSCLPSGPCHLLLLIPMTLYLLEQWRSNHLTSGLTFGILEIRENLTRIQSPLPTLHTCKKSLMAKWLEQASQRHRMYCHDLEVHEFESRSGRTWAAKYFCSKSYLNQKYSSRVVCHPFN